MAGIDNEVFNTLERAVSGDLNDEQSLVARFLSEMTRFGLSVKRVADPLAETPGPVVLGGLLVTPNVNDVSVSAGVMGQQSATLAPVPGPLDSAYRLSRMSGATTVVMPAPGATTYYLIEAQMVEVTTVNALRDIYNPGTMTFAPALVPKQRERQIAFQLLTGGAQAPAPSGGDWVPIAIVRRPGGGGPVAASDIIDVRPLADGRRDPAPTMRRNVLDTMSVAANFCAVDAEYGGAGGLRAFRTVPAGIDVTAATVLSPSTVLGSSTRFFLYLAPWSALSLAPRQFGSPQFEGVLVLSDVAPDAGGLNSALLDLPAPYGVAQAAIGSSYCVGTLVRNTTNTGWVPMVRAGAETICAEDGPNILPLAHFFAPPALGTTNIPLTLAPPNAKAVTFDMDYNGNAGAPSSQLLSIRRTGTALDLASWRGSDDERRTWRVTVPYDGSGSVDMAFGPVADPGTTVLIAEVGWRE